MRQPFDIEYLISELGYGEDSGLLRPTQTNIPPSLAHFFRRAHDNCGVRAVYTLRSAQGETTIPLLYLAESDSEEQARTIHRKIWNQNLVPFVVVSTPKRYVLYPGFTFDPQAKEPELAAIVKDARLSLDAFRGLEADAIADGSIWIQHGREIDLQRRVDWKLLEELEQLGELLRGPAYGLAIHDAHALIGRFVFLRYLRDRGILSDERLSRWGIEPMEVFGRNAALDAFEKLNKNLDEWLNGSIFPVRTNNGEVNEDAINRAAAVFAGDRASGQMSLFEAYDFSFIPIETLSTIYQQFLHAEARGRAKGAYYTPINLVDLILDEVETRRPLVEGISVLDPACGSGAFLVQAYRRLIESQLRAKGKLRPSELRSILTRHVFGVDQDQDACQVASLSLVLTLLDYIDPPDLLRYPDFRLPCIYGSNIVQGDFFDEGLPLLDKDFDCIVGNPPWLELKPNRPAPNHRLAIEWIRRHAKEQPIGGWQLAEAFAWKVGEHLREDGAVGLLMPAMSLFKRQSTAFRAGFFSDFRVWCVANFANLAYVLFGRRAEEPAAAFFYQARNSAKEQDDTILTYAPFVANQPGLRRGERANFRETWVLTVNGGELRHVDTAEATLGESVTWKIAMWGSHRDRRLLASTARRFPSFREFRTTHSIFAHQGLELPKKTADKKLEYIPELVGKFRLRPAALPRSKGFYEFPYHALKPIPAKDAWGRKGRITTPLSVCEPPHLILGRNREWVVYSDEFLVVPHPQLGIAGKQSQQNLLKALTIYLRSNFVRYHQLFYASEMGIKGNVADQITLEDLPTPFGSFADVDFEKWANLQDRQVSCWRQFQTSLLEDHSEELEKLEAEANDLVYQALGLSEKERWLIEDLVQERLQLIKGKSGDSVASPPNNLDIQAYGAALKGSLDSFTGDLRHVIDIDHSATTGIVAITLDKTNASDSAVRVQAANAELAHELNLLRQRLTREHPHWLYFERGLTLFQGRRIFLVKPMQRLHWLRSQALLDADNLIADMLTGGDMAS